MPAGRTFSIICRHPGLRLDRRSLARTLGILEASRSELSRGGAPFLPGELSIVFLTDAALARLHADFLGDPSPTDVITFEAQPEFGSAGEICVSVDAAARHRDFAGELTLYIAHGWLHLAGHDDLQPLKKRAMRRAEARALRILRRFGANPDFRLLSSQKRLSAGRRG